MKDVESAEDLYWTRRSEIEEGYRAKLSDLERRTSEAMRRLREQEAAQYAELHAAFQQELDEAKLEWGKVRRRIHGDRDAQAQRVEERSAAAKPARRRTNFDRPMIEERKRLEERLKELPSDSPESRERKLIEEVGREILRLREEHRMKQETVEKECWSRYEAQLNQTTSEFREMLETADVNTPQANSLA